jgi:(hydroxyamino)benzene mutase
MNRLMMRLGFALILLGLLTAFAIPSLANPRMGLAAHTVAIMGGLVLVVVGAVAGSFTLGPRASRIFAGSWIYATYTNWLGCLLAALTGASRLTPIAGAGTVGTPVAEGIVAFVFLSEAAAALTGAGLALWGLRPRSETAVPPMHQAETTRAAAPAAF